MRFHPAAVALTCVAALLAPSGCGFLTDPAPPDAAAPVTGTPPPAAAPSPSPPPIEPKEFAAAGLSDQDRGLSFSGSVRVTRSPVAVGLPPLPGPVAADCALPDDGSVRTLTVSVTFANTSGGGTVHAPLAGLAATATVATVDGGPPRPGTTVLVESSAPDARWCQEGSTAPTSDGFGAWAPAGGEMTVEVHVVVRDAAPLSGLVLRLAGLRNEAGGNATGPWDRVTASLGGCADDPAALCVPLG
ncbi:hypothetical protein [Blastococcus sp. SYSU DS1024]